MDSHLAQYKTPHKAMTFALALEPTPPNQRKMKILTRPNDKVGFATTSIIDCDPTKKPYRVFVLYIITLDVSHVYSFTHRPNFIKISTIFYACAIDIQ